MAQSARKSAVAAEPPSGQMTAWDLADAIVDLLRDRADLVRPDIDDEGDVVSCDFDDQLVREIERLVQQQLAAGGVRP